MIAILSPERQVNNDSPTPQKTENKTNRQIKKDS